MEDNSLRSVSYHRPKIVDKYNIIIVGGGPAGIAAGIYGKYDGNTPLIIEEKSLAWIPENHVNLLNKLEGFPGLLNTVNGSELVARFRHSLREMDVEYTEGVRVNSIKRRDAGFVVSTDSIDYLTRAIVLATGTIPRQLPQDITEKYTNDIYYFALDNYKKYIGKNVVVLGSRNSGSTAALYLARHGLNVTILEIKPVIQAKEKHTQYFEGLGIKTITGARITRLGGRKGTLGNISYIIDGRTFRIDCAALFCYIGVVPNVGLAQSLKVELDENQYAVTNFYQTTNEKGVFVAGDICGDLKHIIAASGQGAKAAYNINKFFSASRVE